ncbi:MAG: 1,4-dihydroxy-6-naphthoate synthase [Trueperaceae bacterium]|nr:MAG: 1,4-dihydroxy-6-naphthoate synthase [Trueperaceae bacterium]
MTTPPDPLARDGSAERPLRLGFSPCPNDCVVFNALLHDPGLTDLHFDVVLDDVEALNTMAEAGTLDVAKISYHAAATMLERWALLPSGGALGRGVGPLIVTREHVDDLRGLIVAVPGGRTTARLLLALAHPEAVTTEIRYDRIMPAVAAGEVAAGLIIHESRFTYAEHGLHAHSDLGAWWEASVGELIPLGAIGVRRDLPSALQSEVARAVHASVTAAFRDPRASEAFVARHAQEMSREVRAQHVALYVNEHTLDVGVEGRRAVAALMHAARTVHRLDDPGIDPFVAWQPPTGGP